MTGPLPPPAPSLRACVVVPARDEEGRIGACIDALAAQEGVPRADFEVILVVDGCTDATVDRAITTGRAHPGLRLHVLASDAPGAGAARRRGMDEAARRLGWAKGTVLTRLAWARKRLRSQLVRRGVAVSAGSFGLLLGRPGARAVGPAEGCEVLEIGDRREAIAAAVERAEAGDVVFVAGKGHEEGQTSGSLTLPFSDHEEVRKAIREQFA